MLKISKFGRLFAILGVSSAFFFLWLVATPRLYFGDDQRAAAPNVLDNKKDFRINWIEIDKDAFLLCRRNTNLFNISCGTKKTSIDKSKFFFVQSKIEMKFSETDVIGNLHCTKTNLCFDGIATFSTSEGWHYDWHSALVGIVSESGLNIAVVTNLFGSPHSNDELEIFVLSDGLPAERLKLGDELMAEMKESR